MLTFPVIPLALLTQPYFRADVPQFIPYATIGLIFSHEMLHGFDMTGIRYDANGEPKEWFSPESRLRLEARLDCVARQYGATFWKKVSFKGASIDVQVNYNNYWKRRETSKFCQWGKLTVWSSGSGHTADLLMVSSTLEESNFHLQEGDKWFISSLYKYLPCNTLS